MIEQILNQYGTNVVDQIRRNMAQTGTDATGKTSKSLHYIVETNQEITSLKVYGRAFFGTVETGRRATPDKKPSREMITNIKDWMAARGITGSAFAIANSINKKGTKLHQAGGRENIYSSVINQELMENIKKDILTRFGVEWATTIKTIAKGWSA